MTVLTEAKAKTKRREHELRIARFHLGRCLEALRILDGAARQLSAYPGREDISAARWAELQTALIGSRAAIAKAEAR